MKCPECAQRFVEGFIRGRATVFRKNNSGCVCVIDDDNNIISVCGAHQELIEEALKTDKSDRVKDE
jgi:hypothetical protein